MEKKKVSGEELVSMHLFKDNERYKDDVFVAVNGQTCQIRRGEDVQIKRKFAEVLERSMEQDGKTADLLERESGSYRRQAEKLGM